MLNNSQVDNNTASHTSGAGIVNHGTMTLNKSEVNGNTAAGSGVVASGGGIINAQGPPGAVGTGILTLNNSQVNNNRAGGDGGGIANGVPLPGPMPLVGGAVTLNHSQVTGNTAAHNVTVQGNTPGMSRWRKHLFIATSRITADAAEYFHLPNERTVVMGSRIEL